MNDTANIDGSLDGYSAVAEQIQAGKILTNSDLESVLAESYGMLEHPKRKRLFLYALYHAVPQTNYLQVLKNYDELVWLVR